MSKGKKSNSWTGIVAPILIVFVGLIVLIGLLLDGANVALVHTGGLIANEQLRLIVTSMGILLGVAIPVVALLYFTAWRYRESNTKVKRNPNVGHSKLLNVTMWVIPAVVAVVLASIIVPATHRLEPKKEIAADAEPLTVQVVAMRWKWLFIYPDQQIATVNYVRIPVGTPVTFELTADEAPMSSFWIPNLGGMLYAMSGGHVNKLNLIATAPGEYPGSTAEINGDGFAGMRFTADATSKEEFDQWVREVDMTSEDLSTEKYDELLKPSEKNPVAYYALPDRDLYTKVITKYKGSGHDHKPEQYEAH